MPTSLSLPVSAAVYSWRRNTADIIMPAVFVTPVIIAAIGIVVRHNTSSAAGDMKDILGRKAKKDLRQKVYNKIVKLGVRSTDGMSMAGLTQVSMEGVEQLDLYYSSDFFSKAERIRR